MKIYTPAVVPDVIIRVQIVRKGEDGTEHLAFEETTHEEILEFCQEAIRHMLANHPEATNPFERYRTQLLTREFVKGKAGKTKSVSFHGISPKDTKRFILEYLNSK